MRNLDMPKKVFGRWTVLDNLPIIKNEDLHWLCECSCGVKRYVHGTNLRNGASSSCGCLQREKTTKHGDHLTKIHSLWRNFRYRCNCVTSKDYPNYGAKGIFVHPEWNDYEKFKKWAISSGYKEGLTIERKNNDGGYTPENCVFVTIAENNKNKRNTYWWYLNGKKFKSSYDAAKYFRVSGTTIMAWCHGLTTKRKYYPPKKNCYAIKKYKEQLCQS